MKLRLCFLSYAKRSRQTVPGTLTLVHFTLSLNKRLTSRRCMQSFVAHPAALSDPIRAGKASAYMEIRDPSDSFPSVF